MCHSINKNIMQHWQRGVTLVELIVAMVIISFCLTGVLLVMNFTTRHSADPMLQQQAMAIAEAYIEEIGLQNYANPTVGGYTGSTRNLFDDVDDYNGLNNSGATDQNGNPVNGLELYDVVVTVAPPANIGPVGNPMLAKKITVQVSMGSEVDLDLVGYRTDYP